MAGIVDVPARTGNRPAAIQRFQAIHDSRQIFDDGQVAPGEFSSIKGDVKNIFLPPPGAAVLICDIQPLSPRRRSGVVALNDCISAAGIFFSSDDTDLDPRGQVVMESILET